MSTKQEVIQEAIQIIRSRLKEKKWFDSVIREQLGLIDKYNKE